MKLTFNHTITYWAPTTSDGVGGLSFCAPVTFIGRWTDKQEELLDIEGERFVSTAIVHSPYELAFKGYVYFGTSYLDDPRNVTGARQLRAKKRTSAIDGSDNVYRNWTK